MLGYALRASKKAHEESDAEERFQPLGGNTTKVETPEEAYARGLKDGRIGNFTPASVREFKLDRNVSRVGDCPKRKEWVAFAYDLRRVKGRKGWVDSDFALSCLNYLEKHGGLTEKQWAYCLSEFRLDVWRESQPIPHPRDLCREFSDAMREQQDRELMSVLTGRKRYETQGDERVHNRCRVDVNSGVKTQVLWDLGPVIGKAKVAEDLRDYSYDAEPEYDDGWWSKRGYES